VNSSKTAGFVVQMRSWVALGCHDTAKVNWASTRLGNFKLGKVL
jgi:hypothetical protein